MASVLAERVSRRSTRRTLDAEVLAGGRRRAYEWGKRAVDVLVGLPLALLTLPVIGVLAVAVMVSLRTWKPIFVQDRVGMGGRIVRLPKLRTLPLSTPPYADKYALASVAMTRLGRLLRATHLDELPQLLLVPLGRMSLVGPRPEMPGLAAKFEPAFAAARTTVRPGCTGLWQVSSDVDRLIHEAPQYDMHYLRYRSFGLDLWIAWRTLLALVPATSRVTLDDLGHPSVPRRRGNGIGLAQGSARPASGMLLHGGSGPIETARE